jgi:phosphoglycolate phosphatase
MLAPLVVFDLDGTLIDTAPDLVAALNVVFARIGLPGVAYEEARNMVGGGAQKMIERGLAAEGRSLSAAELDGLVRDFIAHYAAHIADNSRPFAGIEAALDQLNQAGCRLAVCTNKLEWLARRLLDTLSMTSWFVAICGPDTFGRHKPDAEFLRRTIARAGGLPAAAVMVGDSINDVGMAKAAAIPVIAVDYGYTEISVRALGADRVIADAADLPGAVFELFALGEPQRGAIPSTLVPEGSGGGG